MDTETLRVGRRRRLRLALIALAAALVAFGVGAQGAFAGTWYIHPLIENRTESTEGGNCWGHSTWTGCVVLTETKLEDGEFTNENHYGGAGGRHELPAKISSGEYLDEPSFDAPHPSEGAEGFFTYQLPDGNSDVLLALDDVDGGYHTATPSCSVASSLPVEEYACLATNESSDKTEPSNEDFKPRYTFSPVGEAEYTAAGQRCTIPGHERGWTCVGRGWSPTDPGAYMLLTIASAGANGKVVVKDISGPEVRECDLSGQGETCSLMTVPDLDGYGNTIEVENTGSESAEIEIKTESEIPEYIADGKYERIEWIVNRVREILEHIGEMGAEVVVGGPAVLSDLHVSAVPAAGSATSTALGATASSQTTPAAHLLTYRDDHAATTIFTLARAVPGARQGGSCVRRGAATRGAPACTAWVSVGPRRRSTAVEVRLSPHHKKQGSCPRQAKRLEHGACHLKVQSRGHLRHRDSKGLNKFRFAKVDGKPLAPGRYRVAAIAVDQTGKSKPVHTTFTVGR